MRLSHLLLVGLLFTAPLAAQQAQPIVVGERFEIESEILGEARPVFVAVPDSYSQGSERYGVLYVLDAETQFGHTASTTKFLSEFVNQKMPPVLVVGIGSTNRMRDLTPPLEQAEGVNTFGPQGGADRFLSFVLEELRPWIEQTYRSNEHSVLIGHSLGGLFGLHALFTEPEAFDGYVLVDPSLNWDSRAPVRRLQQFLQGAPETAVSLYLSFSGEGPDEDVSGDLLSALESMASSGMRWSSSRLETEQHDTIPIVATYQGLLWTYSSWDIEAQASALFGDGPAQEVMNQIDALYRSSGEQFGVERQTSYFVFEALLGYLVDNERLDEAAALTLQYSDRYPLPLVPNVTAGIAGLLAAGGDEAAAVDYLQAVLERFPQDDSVRNLLLEMGVEPAGE